MTSRVKLGEHYYIVSTDMSVEMVYEEGSRDDDSLYKFNNYFTNQQEASLESRLREFEALVTAEFKRLNGGVFFPKPNKEYFAIGFCAQGAKTYMCPHGCQRGWMSGKREVVDAVIDKFGDSLEKWWRGEL